MEMLNKKDNQIVFTVKIDETITNAVRRYVNQIPILAIDEVEISKNDSPLYDETVAHRMGLIPLKMPKSGDGSNIHLKLVSKKEGFVYSEELKGNIEVAYGKIPITSLNKNQEFEVTANLRLGKGLEHSKFSPGLMFYRNVIEAKIEGDCPKEVLDKCPAELTQAKGKKIIVKDSALWDLIDVCAEECIKQGKDCIKITPTDELVVTIESFGQISPEEIFKKSVEALKKDLHDVSKKLEKA